MWDAGDCKITPADWLDPPWDEPNDTFDWRWLVAPELQVVWLELTEPRSFE